MAKEAKEAQDLLTKQSKDCTEALSSLKAELAGLKSGLGEAAACEKALASRSAEVAGLEARLKEAAACHEALAAGNAKVTGLEAKLNEAAKNVAVSGGILTKKNILLPFVSV